MNAARNYSASRIKEIIELDRFFDSDRLIKRVLPIDQQMIEEIKAFEEHNYINRIPYHKYIYRFLRPENDEKIGLVAGEMRRKINQLQTKETV